ncbi:MAG: glucose-6-phosphate isomerase, partial [Paramuribaculum sp.]|nr:glucose-6-phosphate isomerase [Paramuribaculum sp.]
MQQIKVDISGTASFISDADLSNLKPEAQKALQTLDNGTGAGNDFLGWNTLPSEITTAQIDEINATAAKLRNECKVVVCIGIGGSYLGAKAVIEALS